MFDPAMQAAFRNFNPPVTGGRMFNVRFCEIEGTLKQITIDLMRDNLTKTQAEGAIIEALVLLDPPMDEEQQHISAITRFRSMAREDGLATADFNVREALKRLAGGAQ